MVAFDGISCGSLRENGDVREGKGREISRSKSAKMFASECEQSLIVPFLHTPEKMFQLFYPSKNGNHLGHIFPIIIEEPFFPFLFLSWVPTQGGGDVSVLGASWGST